MEFITKNKIIIGIFIIIVLVIGIYVYNTRFLNNNYETIDSISKENKNSYVEDFLEKDIKSNKNIIIHITGAVKKPGIVKLNEGARIYEAIDKAEGGLENADLSRINLAYKLEDGQKIYVPYIGENLEENLGDGIEYIIGDLGNNNGIINNNKGENSKVNINTANQTELETLPGIGTSTAEKIIDYRNKNGKFESI